MGVTVDCRDGTTLYGRLLSPVFYETVYPRSRNRTCAKRKRPNTTPYVAWRVGHSHLSAVKQVIGPIRYYSNTEECVLGLILATELLGLSSESWHV